jgi:hypothetical protein
MANSEKFQTFPVICEGGWNSNENYILLSQRAPGQATSLINFEISLFGGYRRINGFTPLEPLFPEVDSAGAEGKILTVAIAAGDIITARKTQATTTYKFYKWVDGLAWDDYTTGLTLTATGVDKIRHVTFNFGGDEHIMFTDGINNASILHDTTWSAVSPSATGADHTNAGGTQALAAPKYITMFKNHIFVSGDSTNPQIVAHSAPNAEYDWTSASGAGQLIAPFEVVQIKPFRDELFVFGVTDIKKIVVENSTFVFKDVATNIGCLASDSVIEVNGDLLFLAQDGFRTIAATDRVGDVELGNQAKAIQQDILDKIASADLAQVDGVVVRSKSQVRFFFSDENLDVESNEGIIGSIRGGDEIEHTGTGWEWGELLGIRTSCVTSAYLGSEEYVLHGDHNGKVYRQEQGSDFDGANIRAVYTMPYLDFGDVFVRKSIHKISVFLRAEGDVLLNTALQFNWSSAYVFNPNDYTLENSTSGAVYGTGVYDTDMYAAAPAPVVLSNVEGSGESVRITFSSFDTSEPYSIQAVIFEYAVNGRK